jgi:Arc/MetJ-type ribon-helix-helix transcriptional regulator
MPEALIEAMDELVKKGLYTSRSAELRTAVRDLLRRELWSITEKFKEAKQATGVY